MVLQVTRSANSIVMLSAQFRICGRLSWQHPSVKYLVSFPLAFPRQFSEISRDFSRSWRSFCPVAPVEHLSFAVPSSFSSKMFLET
jgi:hypothetical protein